MVGMTADGFCRRKERDAELSRCLENGRKEGKMSLRRLQWKSAQAGDRTMLVWLGKQYLGQTDKQNVSQEVTGKDGAELFRQTPTDELERIARRIIEHEKIQSTDANS